MFKIKSKLKYLFFAFLIVYYVSGQGVRAEEDDDSDDDEETDTNLKASASEDSKSDDSNGRVMQLVVNTINEVNPIKLLKEIDPDPILKVNGIDIQRLKVPAGYIPDLFFDKFSKKTGISKQEMSKEFGGDVEKKGEKDWISIGAILKVGKSKDLKLGDYCEFMGINLDKYEKQYHDQLLEFFQKPVAFIDDLLDGGAQRYMAQLKSYASTNGGYMNAAMTAVDKYTKSNITERVSDAITKAKTFDIKKEKVKLEKEWEEYQKKKKSEAKKAYDEAFGKGGTVFQLQTKALKTFDSFIVYLRTGGEGDQLKAFVDMIGNLMGPTGRALTYMVYRPSATMFNQIFGPLILIPTILGTYEDPFEKLLAVPPVILHASGGMFKPVLTVFEPLLRLTRFIITSEYYKSLSAGLDLAAGYGINIWGGSYTPRKPKPWPKPDKEKMIKMLEKLKEKGKQMANKSGSKSSSAAGDVTTEAAAEEATDAPEEERRRRKRDTKKKGAKDEEVESWWSKPLDPKDIANDQKLADAYQGGPPPKGYKLGVRSNKSVDLDDEDLLERVLLSPDFILKAGGPMFVPFASVIAPTLRALNIVIFGKDDLNKRLAEVPDIIRGVGVVGPLADVIQALLPYIKTAVLYNEGKLGTSDLIIQLPNLVKHATSGVLYNVYKHPEQLLKAMLSYLEGTGGLVGMLRLQAEGRSPKTALGASMSVREELKGQADFVLKAFGDFLGEWLLGYIQALGPIGSLNSAFMNGIIGEVIDPSKYIESNIDLRHQPLKAIITSFEDLSLMTKAAADKKIFLTALLGGQDPDVLNNVGINAEKLALNNIDPGLLVGAGKLLLSEEEKKKLSKSDIGLDLSKLSKVGVDSNTFLDTGLLTADDKKLKEMGINMDSILNKIMRNSITDHKKLLDSGINVRSILKAGVDPTLFLVGGGGAVKGKGIKNFDSLSDDDLNKYGLNTPKLKSVGIDAKALAQKGLEDKKSDFGLNVQRLIASVYNGLEVQRVMKSGVDLKKLLNSGYDPKIFLTGGIKEALNNDLSEESLEKIGIKLKEIVAMGINPNLLADHGAGVLNPINMLKIGIDPMRVMVGTLSRSGLDVLTVSPDEAGSVSLEFVQNIVKIIKLGVDSIPVLYDVPFIGRKIVDKNGRFIGPTGILLYKIIGIEGGGLLEITKKAMNGTLTKEEMMKFIKMSPKPPQKPKQKRVKEDPKSVEEYVKQSINLRVGPKVTPKPGKMPWSRSKGDSAEGEAAATEASKGMKSKFSFGKKTDAKEEPAAKEAESEE